MKYVVVLGDGMADNPVAELGGKTPLQVARKPNMDALAARGELGLARTVPLGMNPASDVANLAVMGYDPAKYYTGRSPLEAVSMGLELGSEDVAFRCNLVALSEEADYASKTMLDYSSGEITSEEAKPLVEAVQARLGTESISFHPGISYRHCMIWKKGPMDCSLTPPHDISLKPVRDHLPAGEGSGLLLAMMDASREVLEGHPVNRERRKRGLVPATSIWLWGQGRRPSIPSFKEKYGLEGSMISAVDLLKGLGICAGMRSIDVEGATGTISTNFRGKAEAALAELRSGRDFVYVHLEAPDECGHHRQIAEKVRSIELIDELVLGTLLKGFEGGDGFRVLVMPDHPTPLDLRTHTSDPVPFLIYDSRSARSSGFDRYDEAEAKKSGLVVERGFELMGRFLGGA